MPARVRVGVVGKPLGLRGEVFVRPDADVGHTFAAGQRLRGDDDRDLVVAASRLHGNRVVVRFEGVDSRDGAEALRGVALTVGRDELELDAETFWSDELVGREVVDEHGDLVGVLEASLDGAAHDYLVVARPDGGELLVPAVAELVDVAEDRIVVRRLPGLLDPDGAW